MIQFFRRIRQKLITEGKLTRYLIYAIGEILLVMIGILLAFQVSQWNEDRKTHLKEAIYLRDIQKDIQGDLSLYSTRIQDLENRLSLMHLIDPFFQRRDTFFIQDVDTSDINVYHLFRRPNANRVTNGSYNALVSSGNTEIISNKDLLSRIKKIYDKMEATRASTYTNIKEREEQLALKYSYEWRYASSQSLASITDKALIADLNYFYIKVRSFYGAMVRLEAEMKAVDHGIDQELKKIR